MPPAEIIAELTAKQSKATAFEHLIGGIIEKAIRKKDEKKAEWLLARTLGKMRERLDISSKSVKVSVTTTASLPTMEQLALENPDLTQSQLESFSDKLQKLRDEIAASKKFTEETIEVKVLEAPPGDDDCD